MSEYAARQALERMNLRTVAISLAHQTLESDLRSLSLAVPEVEEKRFMDRRADLCAAYGFSTTPQQQQKPFAFANGIAIIPIHGSLINRFGGSYGYITGYNFIRRQMSLALADEDVKGIVFDVNSGGGECNGCFELADDIFKARSKKPSMAVIDSSCYSAAYALGSAASKMVLTPGGGAGSIGVVAMHMDVSGALDQMGLKMTFIHFGAHKVDGNMFEALSKEVKADIQASVDESGEKFVATVARNRNIAASKVKDTEARCYRAEDAKSLGLIDTIAPPQEAMQVFSDELSGSAQQPLKEEAMTQATTQPAADAPALNPTAATPVDTAALQAQARTAEKARISSILGCEEAKGKTTMANHLAMNTEMDLAAAQGILKASPAEVPAKAETPNPFKEAMNNSEQPKIGAGGGEGGGEGGEGGGGETAAQSILRNQAAATGGKLELVKK